MIWNNCRHLCSTKIDYRWQHSAVFQMYLTNSHWAKLYILILNCLPFGKSRPESLPWLWVCYLSCCYCFSRPHIPNYAGSTLYDSNVVPTMMSRGDMGAYTSTSIVHRYGLLTLTEPQIWWSYSKGAVFLPSLIQSLFIYHYKWMHQIKCYNLGPQKYLNIFLGMIIYLHTILFCVKTVTDF